ncbi:hypothetical protein [Chamaesiphon sp.]|uniref:hypothetical protein n=1 Tax=Chamaesiphon sp. TaxID=2814140 RepID=UPI0035945BA5
MNQEKNSFLSSQVAASSSLAANVTSPIADLAEITTKIHDIADRDRADPVALLQLLRTLEQLHHEIQQGYFQSALPNTRQALYSLLRDIEENGGWPYIQRWKLQELFANLAATEKSEP